MSIAITCETQYPNTRTLPASPSDAGVLLCTDRNNNTANNNDGSRRQ